MQAADLEIFKKAPMLIWHGDLTGARDWFNDAWLDFSGRTAAQEQGLGWMENVWPEDRDILEGNVPAGCFHFTTEYRLRNQHGEYRWLRDQAVADAEGNGFIGYCIDITELKLALNQLEEQQSQLKQAQEIARIGYFTYDMQHDLWESPYILTNIFGIDQDYPRTLEGWLKLVIPESREEMRSYLQEIVRQRQSFHRCYQIRRPSNGETRWLQGDGKITYDCDGAPVSMIGTIRDITDEISVKNKLSMDAMIFDHSQQAILITDTNRHILRINDAFSRIMGYSQQEVEGQNPRILNSGLQDAAFYESMWHSLNYSGKWHSEIWNRRKDGSLCPGILDINAVHDDAGNLLHYVGIFTEITELKNTQRNLERLVNLDSLTGLPNRALMMDRMNQAISNSTRYNRMVAVCFLDLDDFKPVNDNHGHVYGDALLVEVAGRLTAAVRGGDTVARLGGDEFVLILTELEHGYEIEPTLDRVMQNMAKPYAIRGETFQISASLGVTVFPRDYSDAETLLRHADIAMYRAKQSGKNHYRIYVPEK